MQDPADLVPQSLLMRTTPVQQRGAERITQLLDAAAELIDDQGIDGLTTTAVAARSGSSVGVVYRYFPNIQALLRGLGARNQEEYGKRAVKAVEQIPEDWLEAPVVMIDEYVEMMRTVPGFRAVRFGGIIDERFMLPGETVNNKMARQFAELISERYSVPLSEEFLFDVEVLIECAEILLRRAFHHDKSGDLRFIERARQLPREFLGKYELAGARG